MTNVTERTLRRLGDQLSGGISTRRDARFAAATATWALPIGRAPRAVAHCRTAQDVQTAIRAARESELPLSVRGGGHDWAGRALCDGLVIDLGSMNGVILDACDRTARLSGGARAGDVAMVTDPVGLAAVTGSVGAVGMAGLTLGGGYGPLIARFGLALDNLLGAEVVMANGRIVTAGPDGDEELFWALRGGGGNFGVVTSMQCRLHALPSVRSGLLFYPFNEAKAVLQRCVERTNAMVEELTVQVGLIIGPDNVPAVLVVPTWCGDPQKGEAELAPFLELGTLLAGTLDRMSYGACLRLFDPYIVSGQQTFMETCWLDVLDSRGIDRMIEAMTAAAGPGCAIFTHEFRGAATRVPAEATAFGLRRDHVLVEILATLPDAWNDLGVHQHREWARHTLRSFDGLALPGGYPNFLTADDADRVARSYGPNANRLVRAKRRYDPDNVFNSAIPLPAADDDRRLSLREILDGL
jgi:FAD/FMN-containing dehydrogenase